MKIENAKHTLLRRQAHLLTRFVKSNKNLTYDKLEYHAISVVLMELKKLEMEVYTLKGNAK